MVSLRKHLLILALVVGSLFGFGAWSVLYDYPRIHAELREQGVEAGRDGVPAEACPYEGGESRRRWLEGWIDGYRQRDEK